VKILASVLTLMGVVSMGSASFAMESGNCSKVIYKAAVQAAHQAEDGAAIVSNLRYAGSFQRATGETEVNWRQRQLIFGNSLWHYSLSFSG
jgi:hypothetical protein